MSLIVEWDWDEGEPGSDRLVRTLLRERASRDIALCPNCGSVFGAAHRCHLQERRSTGV